MEIFFNDNLIGVVPKSSKKISIKEIISDDKSLIRKNNRIKVNEKEFYINEISDNLINLKNTLNEKEFQFNIDMYEELVPIKYSIIKKNNNIYLYSLEIQ